MTEKLNAKKKTIAIGSVCALCLFGAAGIGWATYGGEEKTAHEPTPQEKHEKVTAPVHPFSQKKDDQDAHTSSPFQQEESSSLEGVLASADTSNQGDQMDKFQSEQETEKLQQQREKALQQLSQHIAQQRQKEKEVALLQAKKEASILATPAVIPPAVPEKSVTPSPQPQKPEDTTHPTPMPEPTPTPSPNPVPTPDPEPLVKEEAYLSVPRDITVHVLAPFDIQSYAVAVDEKGQDISTKIQTKEPVMLNQVGDQIITVQVQNGKALAEAQITLHVVNDAPQMEGITNQKVEVGQSFDARTGISAKDTEEGDLTDFIQVDSDVDTNQLGDYLVTYTITDQFGAQQMQTCVVTVYAQAPTIKGAEDMELPQGTAFDPMEGVQVLDAYGDVTLTVTGEVNGDEPGVYQLQYTAVNKYQQKTEVVRTVTVTPSTESVE